MARQQPTHADTPDWTLSPQPAMAVALLASGPTATDTTLTVEVTRQTMRAWLNHHPGFQAALHSRRQGLWVMFRVTLSPEEYVSISSPIPR
jgi:hypothetical protein